MLSLCIFQYQCIGLRVKSPLPAGCRQEATVWRVRVASPCHAFWAWLLLKADDFPQEHFLVSSEGPCSAVFVSLPCDLNLPPAIAPWTLFIPSSSDRCPLGQDPVKNDPRSMFLLWMPHLIFGPQAAWMRHHSLCKSLHCKHSALFGKYLAGESLGGSILHSHEMCRGITVNLYTQNTCWGVFLISTILIHV